MFDLILRNGTVIDGTGRPGYKSDVGILGGRIAALGDLSGAESRETIDVSSMAVCPGFIDMHSHSDLSILAHSKAESSISQGITTEVVGNCGWSMAPVKAETRESVLKRLLGGLVNREAFSSLEWNWHSFGEFLDALEKAGTGVNIVPQVGQSLIRAHVVGTEKRNATRGEIEAMKDLVRESLEEGAWGLSTGRSYRPGGFAPTEEIIALAKVVAKYGGIYATHMKSEGDDLFSAVEEACEIAEKSGVKVEISHHKAVGKKNFGKVHKSLEMIASARQRGLAISVDVYPYEFAQISSLIRLFPEEVWDHIQKASGSGPKSSGDFPTQEEIQEALKDPAVIRAIKSMPGLGPVLERVKNYLITNAPSAPDLEGRILGEYAEEKGLDLADFLVDLLGKDGLGVHAAWPISIDDVYTVVSADFAMVGTDAFTLDRPIYPTPIHPRHYGTFPRVIGRFVRDKKLFSLEDAVKKCTYMPARILGIPYRGCVEVGFWADLVVFDPTKLEDTATAKKPYDRSLGIEYVLVNGKIALEKGEVRPVFAGKVLRRQ
ncbi:MAG TPA: D-aminoacylase [Firmicutes bacterium]|nr:D-aminoacylase [Candidatus Fermentithermobacillaceae bacterium]